MNTSNQTNFSFAWLRNILLLCVLVFSFGLFSTMEVHAEGLNQSNATLYIGSTINLEVYDNTPSSWTSSNKRVATVSKKGQVTAKSAGNTIITVKCKNGKKYTCRVSVKSPYLSASTKTIHSDSSAPLQLIGTQAQSFTSSNSSIASVSGNGLITGLKAGNCKITVKGANGKSYTCKVNVTAHKPALANNSSKATCTKDGKLSDTKCTACGKILIKGKIVPATNHKDTKKVLVREANCSNTGLVDTVCKSCNAVIDQDIIPKNKVHKNVELKNGWATTCYYTGYTGDKVCRDCNSVVSFGVQIPSLEHNWELTDQELANCSYGTRNHYTCSTCFSTKEETLDNKLTHIFVKSYEKKSSCVQDGYILFSCTICNENYEERTEATGHEYELSEDKKSIICKNEKCHSVFTAKISEQVEDGKLYVIPYRNFAIGQTLTVKGELPSNVDYDYYEYNRMYLDFWSNMRVETSNTDSVEILKHDYQTGYVISPTETINIDQQDVLWMKAHGTSHVKLYFHDILYDEFDVYVGATIVEGIKELRSGNSDASLFKGYSELQQLNVQAIVEMLDATVTDSMTDYEKVNAILNWYDNNVTYQTTGVGSDSLSEIFLNHQGQCEDYAESFGLLMDVLEIDCYYVSGSTSNDGLHAWNMIKLDAGNDKGVQWYYADMTWHQFDTYYTIPELNELGGMGFYPKGDSSYRISEQYLKLRNSDYANETEPYTTTAGKKKFSEFEF